MSALEWIGFVLGAISLWLAVGLNVWNWPVGIVNSAAWLLLFFDTRLYLNAFHSSVSAPDRVSSSDAPDGSAPTSTGQSARMNGQPVTPRIARMNAATLTTVRARWIWCHRCSSAESAPSAPVAANTGKRSFAAWKYSW